MKRTESVPKAVRRLGRKRMEKALDALDDCDAPTAVHTVRKDIKQTRSLLRLVRGRLKKKDYQRQIKRLRKATRRLAAVRDAYVKTTAFKKLVADLRGELPAGAVRRVQSGLRAAFEKETERFTRKERRVRVQRKLQRISGHFERLELSRGGWKAISPALKGSYRQGRRAYRLVREHASAENLHTWRKRAKDLWHQIKLLRRIWPEQMDAAANELENLTEHLGDYHDLTLLEQSLAQFPWSNRPPNELNRLRTAIQRRQQELLIAALKVGSHFYAEKPSLFCERLRGYWRVWQGKKKPLARKL